MQRKTSAFCAALILVVLSCGPCAATEVSQKQVDDAYQVMRNFDLWFKEHFVEAPTGDILHREENTFKNYWRIRPELKQEIDYWRRQLSRADVRAVFSRRAISALESRLNELKDIEEDDWFGRDNSELRKARNSMVDQRDIIASIVENRFLGQPSPTGTINDPNAPKKREAPPTPRGWQPPTGLVDLPEVTD